MSLLDTFTLLFETDAGDAISETGQMADQLERTEKAGKDAAKGVDASAAAAAKGSESFSSLVKGVGAALGAYLGWKAIAATSLQAALDTDVLGKFSEALGYNIEQVDAWGEAAIRNGGSAEAFRASIQSLDSSLTEMKLTGGGGVAETLAMLGVNAQDSEGKMKGVLDLLPEIASSFEGLSKQESANLGAKLGLDQGTILMLQQGSVAVDDLVEKQRQLGGRTKEGYKASAEFNDALADTSRMFTGLTDSGNQVFLPFLTKMLGGLQSIVSWAKEHKTFVAAFFIAVAGAVTAFYLPAMVQAAIATTAATWPFILIGAAIVALGVIFAALYEDVKAYLGGQESFVGSLGEKYAWFGKLLDATIAGVSSIIKTFSEFGSEMFNNLSSALGWLGELFSSIFGGASDDMESMGDIMESVVNFIIDLFEMLGSVISGVLGFIASPIETSKQLLDDLSGFAGDKIDQAGDFVSEKASSAWSATKGFFGFSEEDEEATKAALNVQAEYSQNPLNTTTPNSFTQSRQSTSNNFTFGDTNIDARGMDRDQARSLVDNGFRQQIAMAGGSVYDGVKG